jgi:anti-sigma-K factor RskA
MSQFERDLREALRRKEPPPGFAGRVIARSREIEERREARASWKWSWRWSAAVAVVVMLLAGGSLYQERRRQEAERSKDQLLLALRVTGAKVRVVQERLSQIQLKTIELPSRQ